MEDWLLIQNFYNGLTCSTRDHLDAAAGGAFLSLTVAAATELIEKMVSNQGWKTERAPPKQRGMHPVKEVDMLSAKMDLLLKHLDRRAQEKADMYGTAQALDAGITCEVCGNTGHSGNLCPATAEEEEEVAYLNNNGNNNNGYRPQGGQGWSPNRPFFQGNGNFNTPPGQPSLRDIVMKEAKNTENLAKTVAANDKTLEGLGAKIDGLTAAIKNQLVFNKKMETQLAQLAAAVPTGDSARFPDSPSLLKKP